MEKNNTKNKLKRQKDSKGRFVKGNKYSFRHRPGAINLYGFSPKWKAEDSISYQYKHLVKLTVDGFKTWMKDNPEKERTIAQELAYQAVIQARKDLAYLKEVTDRTEGRVSQSIDMTSGGNPIPLLDYIKKAKK